MQYHHGGVGSAPNSFWNNYFFNDIKIVFMKDQLQEQIERKVSKSTEERW